MDNKFEVVKVKFPGGQIGQLSLVKTYRRIMPKRSLRATSNRSAGRSPSKFTKTSAKGGLRKFTKERKSIQTRSISLNTVDNDENISSDEEDDDNYNKEDSEDEADVETADEKRRRLAKQYLANIQNEKDDSDDNEMEDSDQYNEFISERLKQERLSAAGRLYRSYADSFQSLSAENFTHRHYSGHRNSITTLALSSDSTFVVTGGKDNAVVLFDLESGKKSYLKKSWSKRQNEDVNMHQGEVLAVAISSDGRYVASSGRDSVIRVYDKRIRTNEVKTMTGHKGAVYALAFQHNTYNLFSASHDRCIKFWEASLGTYMETLFGHQEAVYALDCWHKQKPLTASLDRSVRLWKVETGTHLVFRKHQSSIDCVQFLNSDYFLSGGQDGKVMLWSDGRKLPVKVINNAHGVEGDSNDHSVQKLQCENKYSLNNPRWIASMAAIKSSDTFATGSYDGYVRIWNLPSSMDKHSQITESQRIAMPGFVNGLAITPEILVAGGGREHRLGRWWNIKGAKDRLTVVRYNQNVDDSNAEASKYITSNVEYSDDDDENEDSDEDDE